MREAVEDLGDDDAVETVDRAAEQALEEALVAEQVDQRQAGQQRGREDRHQRDALEQPCRRQHGPRERIGIEEGERHHDQGAHRGRHGRSSAPSRTAPASRNTRCSWRSPTNLPSRSSKPLASSDHSGRPTMSSSTPTSSHDAQRASAGRRATGQRAGAIRGGRRRRLTPQRPGADRAAERRRAGCRSRPPGRGSGCSRSRPSASRRRVAHLQRRAAEGADEIEVGDLDRHAVGDVGRQVAHAHILRPDAEPDLDDPAPARPASDNRR